MKEIINKLIHPTGSYVAFGMDELDDYCVWNNLLAELIQRGNNIWLKQIYRPCDSTHSILYQEAMVSLSSIINDSFGWMKRRSLSHIRLNEILSTGRADSLITSPIEFLYKSHPKTSNQFAPISKCHSNSGVTQEWLRRLSVPERTYSGPSTDLLLNLY